MLIAAVACRYGAMSNRLCRIGVGTTGHIHRMHPVSPTSQPGSRAAGLRSPRPAAFAVRPGLAKAGRMARMPFFVAVLLAVLIVPYPALARGLLPSQDTPDFYSAKICQDRDVLSIIGSTIDSILHTKSVLAKGMQADDIHLEAVNATQGAVLCSMTVTARGIAETVSYVIGVEDNSFLIVLNGQRGSKLFPNEVTMRPAS
jgi:hypothetical protein